MKNKEDLIFDKLLASKGGLYIPSDDNEKRFLTAILAVLRRLVDDATLYHLDKPLASRVIVNFSQSDEIKANCGLHGGQYYINIDIGTIYSLQFMFNHMLTSPHFMTTMGNRALELRMAEKLPVFDYISFSEIMRDWGSNPYPVPKCPTRRLFAEFLLYQALSYIVLH